MIQALLFDLDGTLVDNNELIFQTFEHLFQEHLGKTIPRNEIVNTFGKPLEEVMEIYFPNQGQIYAQHYRSYNIANHDNLITLCPQVIEGLEYLKSKGLKIALVTSKARPTTDQSLKLFHLEKYFDIIITPELTENHKPHPDPALKALEYLDIPPQNAIMIGDSPYDIQCGHAAGCKTAAVSYSAYDMEKLLATNPDYIIDTIRELDAYLV